MQCEYTKHFESVRRIRNACAHNVCMLASFKSVPGFKSDLETKLRTFRREHRHRKRNYLQLYESSAAQRFCGNAFCLYQVDFFSKNQRNNVTGN